MGFLALHKLAAGKDFFLCPGSDLTLSGNESDGKKAEEEKSFLLHTDCSID